MTNYPPTNEGIHMTDTDIDQLIADCVWCDKARRGCPSQC
jgi:hypothetical protein